MNKKQRHEQKMLKYKKRIKQLNIDDGDGGNYYCYRTSGKPCSCYLCKNEKYSRKTKHKNSEE